MSQKNRATFAKRDRELQRMQRAADKRERRRNRATELEEGSEPSDELRSVDDETSVDDEMPETDGVPGTDEMRSVS